MLSSGVTNVDSVTDFHKYVDKAKEYGMKAFAFSEHGSTFAWLKKKEYIESCGMKYIHAIEAYLTEDNDKKPHLFSATDLVRTEISGKKVTATFFDYWQREDGAWLAKIDDVKDDDNGKTVMIDINTLKDLGYKIGGFDAYITSDVLIGAGLSSSAAFEDIIGTIIDGLYNDMAIDMVTIAKVGQYAENVYFGKPCGLMDQCACAVGGLITIDFKDPENPDVKHVDVDFGEFGYSLCIVDAKGSHANLTDEYAAVPAEMKAVAQFFGKDVLREVNVQDFLDHMDEVREKCGDRAALRAYHFFKENDRVPQEVAALENKDFPAFLNLVKASGNSSYKVLQNVYASSDPQHQSVSLALTLSEDLLGDHGVCRVHGGGFAGTIQAFVANDYVDTYKKGIEKYFGEGSCHVLKVRKYGGKKVL
jgi:galactokinase